MTVWLHRAMMHKDGDELMLFWKHEAEEIDFTQKALMYVQYVQSGANVRLLDTMLDFVFCGERKMLAPCQQLAQLVWGFRPS